MSQGPEPEAINAYATVQEYRDAIDRQSNDDDDEIARDLEAASRWWDGKLNRRAGFCKADEAEPRTYYVHRAPSGGGAATLYVDDIADAEGVEVSIDGVVIDDYSLWPPNAPFGPQPEPYDSLGRLDGWPLSVPITVTAIWGWPEIPAAIVSATIEWTAIWRGESIRATSRVNELDQVVDTSPYHISQINRLTALYRRARDPYVGVG